MYSAKTLAAELSKWNDTAYGLHRRLTIFVTGFASDPAEPLLLEALANHPGCNKLYFIPLDGPAGKMNAGAMHEDYKQFSSACRDDKEEWDKQRAALFDAGELLAYDITDVLKRDNAGPRDSKAIDAALAAHFNQHNMLPVKTDEAHIYLSAHGIHPYDLYFQRRNRVGHLINDPIATLAADYKSYLPKISEAIFEHSGLQVTVPCQSAGNLNDIRAFMDMHNYQQIVLKESNNSCGNGIYRVFRETPDGPLMGEKPHKKGEAASAQIFTLTDNFIHPSSPMLAMEWLDNSKGDIRAVIVNGSCVGAYIRHHTSDTWLCNFAQGGSIHPVDMKRDLSAADRHKLHAIAKTLQARGINKASIDLLANAKGDRFLSEINIGNTDDLVELSTHWDNRNAKFGRLSVADQVAGDLMEAYIEDALKRVAQMIADNPELMEKFHARTQNSGTER